MSPNRCRPMNERVHIRAASTPNAGQPACGTSNVGRAGRGASATMSIASMLSGWARTVVARAQTRPKSRPPLAGQPSAGRARLAPSMGRRSASGLDENRGSFHKIDYARKIDAAPALAARPRQPCWRRLTSARRLPPWWAATAVALSAAALAFQAMPQPVTRLRRIGCPPSSVRNPSKRGTTAGRGRPTHTLSHTGPSTSPRCP